MRSNTKMFRFEDLRVYQEAEDFTRWTYKMVQRWPQQYRYNLADQCIRAALSMALNIAEGSSRTRKDFQHFLTIARGSCFECIAILRIANKEHLINENDFSEGYQKIVSLDHMISALRSKA